MGPSRILQLGHVVKDFEVPEVKTYNERLSLGFRTRA